MEPQRELAMSIVQPTSALISTRATPASFPKLGKNQSTSDAIILIIDRKKLHCVISEGV
jgi:hypothetical protein